MRAYAHHRVGNELIDDGLEDALYAHALHSPFLSQKRGGKCLGGCAAATPRLPYQHQGKEQQVGFSMYE